MDNPLPLTDVATSTKAIADRVATHVGTSAKAIADRLAKADIKTLLAPPPPVTARSSSIRETIDRLTLRLRDAEANLESLNASTTRTALSATFEEAEEHDRALRKAEYAVNQATRYLAAAEAELKPALAEEAKAALQAHAERIAAAVQIVAGQLDTIYAPAVEKIAAFVIDWSAVINAVGQINRELQAAGMGGACIQGPEASRKPPVTMRRVPTKKRGYYWDKTLNVETADPKHGAAWSPEDFARFEFREENLSFDEVEEIKPAHDSLLCCLSLPVAHPVHGGTELIVKPQRRFF